MYIIKTEGLYHHFRNGDPVLHDLHLQVPEGSIYGFLGPNGAGKTTTLRLVLGLLRQQQGIITIFGKSLVENRIEILRKLGSLIESPSIYDHLTAFENLSLLQKIYQCPDERIAYVLNLVGLSETRNKKARDFSLGMKQRLAIAIALLHDPSLLILDEPTNGLDPNGMIEIRELLKKINAEKGTTILISSHLLAEIEKLVTHVGIINKGKLLFQGTLEELMMKRKQSSLLRLRVADAKKAISIISSLTMSFQQRDQYIQVAVTSDQEVAYLNDQLVNAGIAVYELTTESSDLESVFMNLINT